jgi:hypothetical protein
VWQALHAKADNKSETGSRVSSAGGHYRPGDQSQPPRQPDQLTGLLDLLAIYE